MEKERNYGVDALRILAMYMVMMIHVQGTGGVIQSLDKGTATYAAARLIETVCIGSVNIYAIISGYVGGSPFRYGKLIKLWLQLVFSTTLITVLFRIFAPELVSMGLWLDSVLPIMRRTYWYMTAYFGLFLLFPVLNVILEHMTRLQFRLFFVNVFVCMFLLPVLMNRDVFQLSAGYSMLWVVLLYIIGGGVRKFAILAECPKYIPWVLYFVIITLTWLSRFVIEGLTAYIFGEAKWGGALTGITSPLILLASIMLVIAFSKIEVQREKWKSVIKKFAPASLGVYILHVHPLVYGHLMEGMSSGFIDDGPILLIVQIMLLAALLYSVLTMVELCRIKLFRLMHVDAFCEKAEAILMKILSVGIPANE